jgi:hypothetical protein
MEDIGMGVSNGDLYMEDIGMGVSNGDFFYVFHV